MKKATSRMFRFLTIISFIFLIASCDKQGGDQSPADGLTRVSITVGSITSEDIITPDMKSMSTSPHKQLAEPVQSIKTLKKDDIEIDVISIDQQDISFCEHTSLPTLDRVKLAAASPHAMTTGLNPIAAEIPMETGIKYWIVLQNKTTLEFEYSLQAVAGTTLDLEVVKGQEYDWYAYSYDSSDDLDILDLDDPQIQTKTDKPLLHAKGTFTNASTGNQPLVVNFEHQLKQIRIHLDSRGLFGDITSGLAVFTENDYIKTSAFDIFSGEMTGPLTTIETTDIAFTNVEMDSERQKHARYYTADLSQTSYTIELNTLEVILPNGFPQNLTENLQNDGVATFTFSSSGKGKLHHAWLKMWKVIPQKSILHIEGSITYGYGASQPQRASGAFLQEPRNFGTTSNYLRVAGFTHEVQIGSNANALRDRLADPALYPDIIIAGMFGGFLPADYDALFTYLERGGAVFLLIESTNSDRTRDFFRKIFNSTEVTMSTHDIGGSVYKIDNVDSDVLA